MNHLDQMQAMFDQLFTAGQHGPDLSGQKSPEKSDKEVDFYLERINLRLKNSQEREKS